MVLGLRPQSRQEEGSIVNGWLEREERRGYIIGQFWYLVAMDWWKAWNEYVSMPYPCGNVRDFFTCTLCNPLTVIALFDTHGTNVVNRQMLWSVPLALMQPHRLVA